MEGGDSSREYADALEAALAAGYAAPELHEPAPAAFAFASQGRTNFELHGEIARGGMGVILRGRDLELGRDVAIKVLREDLVTRSEVRRRFVEEARIAGQLQHPGIVPVYEFGAMAEGRPYFAMKLIEGRTLSEVLAKRDPAQWHRWLEVFRSVCHTVAYAHSRGVVHRDLKPSNVLIGEFGEVQVVDWGLAKVLRAGSEDLAPEDLADSEATRPVRGVRTSGSTTGTPSVAGSVMGTPAYMSPEQARGELDGLDERSDVFSLGAILCEMLTGAPPYDEGLRDAGSSTVELAAGARLEPAFARIDASEADAELRELCKTCLAPSRSDRPRTAAEIAERVEDYLAKVESRARSAEVRAAAARVRARAILAFSGAGLLLAAAVAAGWWRTNEQRSRRVAEADRHVAVLLQEATLARGREDWTAALTALEGARARVESGEPSEAMRAQVESLGDTIRREADSARAARELAEDNARLLAELQDMRQPEGDSIYPTDWQAFDRRFREIFSAHGLDLQGEDPQSLAMALAGRGRPLELAASLDEWTSVRRHAGDPAGARLLVEVANALDGDDQRRMLRRALADEDLDALQAIAEGPRTSSLAAPTLSLLAHALVEGGRVEDGIRILLGARRRDPSDVGLAIELARALRLSKPARGAEAAAHYEAALALRPSSVEIWHELGDTLARDLGRHEEALVVFRRALEIHPEDAHLVFHVGFALSMLERHEEAVQAYRTSLEHDATHARTYLNLGYSLESLGCLDEALAEYRKTLEVDPRIAGAHHNLSNLLRKLGSYDEAIEAARRSIELDPDVALAHVNLGYCYYRLHRFEEAVASYARARELDPVHAPSSYWLGIALESLGRLDEAVEANREAVRLAPGDPYSRSSLAMTLVMNDPTGSSAAEAIEHARKAVELAPSEASGFSVLGLALCAGGQSEEAIGALERAEAMGSSDSTMARLLLSLCHARLGHAGEARATFARAEPDLDGLLRSYPAFSRFVEEARTRIGDAR